MSENVGKQSNSASARKPSARSSGTQDPRVPKPNVKETTETNENLDVCTLDSRPRGALQRVEKLLSANLGN